MRKCEAYRFTNKSNARFNENNIEILNFHHTAHCTKVMVRLSVWVFVCTYSIQPSPGGEERPWFWGFRNKTSFGKDSLRHFIILLTKQTNVFLQIFWFEIYKICWKTCCPPPPPRRCTHRLRQCRIYSAWKVGKGGCVDMNAILYYLWHLITVLKTV